MTSERELITVALGNYASLVAAQWANGTTQHDTTRRTVYSERRGGSVRVPRMTLLDAPHATRMKFQRDGANDRNNEEDDNNEGERGSRGDGGGDVREAMEFSSAEDSDTSDDNDDNNNYYYSEQRELEEAGGMESSNQYNNNNNSARHRDPRGLCEDAGPQNTSKSMKRIKRELFNEKDELVPWWQYIRSGVSEDCLHVLHPLHRAGGAAGEVPLLHSFGFGLSQLRSSLSSDIDGVMESIRRQLEESDSLQGVQCFLDGDSAFGGAVCNVMNEFWEDAGNKIPAVFFACFQSLPEEVVAPGTDVDFADRRVDEMSLNRLLATSHLTRQDGAVYIPLELQQWRSSFAEKTSSSSSAAKTGPVWLQDDTATAQLVAMLADNALYGIRDNGNVTTLSGSGPAFYLQDWQAAVRPVRSLRVSAALAAVPLPVFAANFPRNDLWEFLQRSPLLSTSQAANGGATFAPLTHPTSLDFETEAGRVLGHALTLRGAGKLRDLTYPRQEALLRYGFPLRTSNYLPLVTENSYPISSTFPHDFVLPRELLASGQLEGIDVGTHVVSTYGSAPMLKGILADAEKVLHRRRHVYEDAYGIDGEEWKEVVEDVMQVKDDYDHNGSDVDDDDDGDFV